jgi:hypothetical protein
MDARRRQIGADLSHPGFRKTGPGIASERKSERVTNEQEELRRPVIPAKAGTQ